METRNLYERPHDRGIEFQSGRRAVGKGLNHLQDPTNENPPLYLQWREAVFLRNNEVTVLLPHGLHAMAPYVSQRRPLTVMLRHSKIRWTARQVSLWADLALSFFFFFFFKSRDLWTLSRLLAVTAPGKIINETLKWLSSPNAEIILMATVQCQVALQSSLNAEIILVVTVQCQMALQSSLNAETSMLCVEHSEQV